MKKIFIQIIFITSLLLAGCKGKDGDPGPAGQTGQTGDTGTTGAKGDTGATGVGFDNAVKEGDILITFSGKRPDNVDFTSKQDFKFSLDGSTPSDDANVSNDGGTLNFYIARYLGAVDEHHNNNYVHVQFQVSPTGVVTPQELDLSTAIIDGNKYFNIYENNYGPDDENNDPFVITNYSFDATTGHLKFNFSATFKSSGSTGYDLPVSGVADVYVFNALNDVYPGD